MAATLKGKAFRWAVQGFTFTAGIVSGTNPQLFQSADFERTADKAYVKDGAGDPVSSAYSAQMKTFRCTVIVAIAGGAAALAAANLATDAHIIPPGTTMTLVDANGTVCDGNYNLNSAKLRLSNNEACMIDLEMENAADNDLTNANT